MIIILIIKIIWKIKNEEENHPFYIFHTYMK